MQADALPSWLPILGRSGEIRTPIAGFGGQQTAGYPTLPQISGAGVICHPESLSKHSHSRESGNPRRPRGPNDASTKFAFRLSKNNKKGPLFRAGLFRILIVAGLYPPPPRPGLVIVMVLSTCPLAHTNMPHGLACRSHRVSGLGNLSIIESLELNPGADGWILTSDFLLTGQAP